jgi:uncharacterized protein (DUF433 family)
MPTTEISHIHRDAEGKAWIDETNIKVLEVVLDYLATGSTPEEIHTQYPSLSLAQIHAALAFYYDHREEFDNAVELSLKENDARWAANQDSPVRARLRIFDLSPRNENDAGGFLNTEH